MLAREDEERAREAHKELAIWDEAFGLYIRGDFESSGRLCSELAGKHPGEKLYQIFAERTKEMAEHPPENWDGVFIYESK